MNDLLELVSGNTTPLQITPILVNFIICIVMSFILRAFYIRRSFSLTGKNHIGSILPILSAVIFLVIVVVKSSLALSLGLVGALSIVRFRTPIKEPEELVYLFLAIAIGLGYGAGYAFLTTLLTVIILITIYFWLSNQKINAVLEYNMVVNWSGDSLNYDDMINTIEENVISLKLVRLDYTTEINTAVLIIVPKPDLTLDHTMRKLMALSQKLTCSFYESKTNW